MKNTQDKINTKLYLCKSNKFYLWDDYNQLISSINKNEEIDPEIFLPILPLEESFFSNNDKKELFLVIKKYIKINQKFFSLKRAQWHLFLQKECLPQLISKNKSFLEKIIHFDFSKDFNPHCAKK